MTDLEDVLDEFHSGRHHPSVMDTITPGLSVMACGYCAGNWPCEAAQMAQAIVALRLERDHLKTIADSLWEIAEEVGRRPVVIFGGNWVADPEHPYGYQP